MILYPLMRPKRSPIIVAAIENFVAKGANMSPGFCAEGELIVIGVIEQSVTADL